jgi:hypothetical protein
VGVVVASIASSLVAGAATGIVLATVGRVNGFRARSFLRRNAPVVRRGAVGLAAVSAGATLACVLSVGRDPAALGLTCVATWFLIALSSWLLLVEEDDDYPGEAPDEPEWWPAFERELAVWTRHWRVPTGPRS